MKLYSKTLIAALTASHGKGFKFEILQGKEFKSLSPKAEFRDNTEFEYRAVKKDEEYRGTIFADGKSTSVLPTGGCKGTGKARRVGAVEQVRELYAAKQPANRKEAIELAVAAGYNKYTAATQFQVWNSAKA